jgi:hypothetical protein
VQKKLIREYPYFEKVALIFIPLAFGNILFGDIQLLFGFGLGDVTTELVDNLPE